ncbi:hypothetical protein V6N13_008238 [Hibiscus sabdariffa]
MVGRRARKSMSGAADDSTTKFPISGKVHLEWLMHRLASPRPGHAQSVGVFVTPVPAWQQFNWGGVSRPSNVRASARSMSQWRLWCALAHCFLRSSIESFARVGCGPVGVDAATSMQWACEW